MNQKPIFEVELTTCLYGGETMGRLPDGRAVFVPFALPGEKARVQITEEKKNFCRAELLEILRPSEQRISPRCPHFGQCGGCHYQHLDYAQQLKIKQDIVRDQFVRLAAIPEPPIQPIRPCSRQWNYRNSVQFHLDSQGKIGYTAANSHRVIPIRECHLPETEINNLWPCLDLESIPGMDRISLRLGSGDDAILVLESSDALPPALTLDLPLSAVHLGPDGCVVLAGDDFIVMEVLGRPFKVSADSFFQVNTLQATAIVKYLLEKLPLEKNATVLDVYCGVGLFSAFFAQHCQRCVGFEVSPSACADFASNLDEFDNVELYQGEAEEILPHLDLKPDIVVVDPPRSGLERPALEAIIRMQPQTLAYISCDPSTLARDVRHLLQAGYTLTEVTPFDMFPQTFHVECVVKLERR